MLRRGARVGNRIESVYEHCQPQECFFSSSDCYQYFLGCVLWINYTVRVRFFLGARVRFRGGATSKRLGLHLGL